MTSDGDDAPINARIESQRDSTTVGEFNATTGREKSSRQYQILKERNNRYIELQDANTAEDAAGTRGNGQKEREISLCSSIARRAKTRDD